MKGKLTQELQQAKNTHHVLQAELDKVGRYLTLSPPEPLLSSLVWFP